MLSPLVVTPLVPATRKQSSSASSMLRTILALSRMKEPCLALRKASSSSSQDGLTRTRSLSPKLAIERATAPTFPGNFGPTRTILNSAIARVRAVGYLGLSMRPRDMVNRPDP